VKTILHVVRIIQLMKPSMIIRHPHNEATTIIQGRASCLNRGPPAASGMRILHPNFDALQHCLNQLEAPTMERVPHGDVPFFGNCRIDTP
jgi:hypothetical protein